MKHIKPIKFDQKLVLIAWGGCLSTLAGALFISQQGWLPHQLTMEITTTFIALLISSVCLAHIYHQHQKWAHKEARLKSALLKKIQCHFSFLGNRKECAQQLEQILETQNTLQQRLFELSHYHKNQTALKHLIDQMNQRKAYQEVLKDLGLDFC